MRLLRIVLVALATALTGAWVGSAFAQPRAPRLSDKDVKAVMEQTENGVKRFIDGMNPQMRTAILRGERGELDIKQILKDFQASISRMRDRFNPPGYSGGTETLDFLRKAKSMDTGIALRPGFSGADAKWGDVVPLFEKLAAAYLIDWNADPGTWVAGRVSDGELKDAGAALKKVAEKYGKDLGNAVKKDKTLDEAAKKGAADRIASLTAAVKGLEELLKRGADATAAFDRTVSAAADLKSFTDGYAGAAPFAGQWMQAQRSIDTIKKAYGIAR